MKSTALPGGFADMVVDAATGHVFVADPTSNEVVVLDLDGDIVTSIPNQFGARALALSGGTLYVAQSTAGQIGVIDTSTLVAGTPLAIQQLNRPSTLAVAGGYLWTSTGQCGAWAVKLARVDMTSGAVTTYDMGPNGSMYCMALRADPTHPTLLYAWDLGLEPATIWKVDVSGAAPAFPLSAWEQNQGNLQDMAVAPDGASLVTASGSPYEFDEFRTSDLQPDGIVYPANPYPTAVDTAAAGGGMVAGGLDGYYGDADVIVYPLHVPAATVSWSGGLVAPQGVKFSPDASRVFAVTQSSVAQGSPYTFRTLVLSGPLPPSTTTTSTSTTSTTASPGTPSATLSGNGSYGEDRVGTYLVTPHMFRLTNTGSVSLHVYGIGSGGADPHDWVGGTDCPAVLPAGARCSIAAYFAATDIGPRSASLMVVDDAPGNVQSVSLSGTGTEGYYLAGADGGVAEFGDAAWYGDASDIPLAAPIVSITTTSNGSGYWLLGRDGGIFSYGNAVFYGSTGGLRLNQPVVGMATTMAGKGYWLVASDGGIFAFGDAAFFGSTGAMRLNQPIVGMAMTPSGNGYWLVASDGGIFAFGDAGFFGSTGAMRLNKPIIGMAPTATGRGYWLVASDGGIFAFGDATFYGSTGAIRLAQPIVGVATTPRGHGYWMAAADGGLFAFGDAPFYGSLGGQGITDAIGIAGTAPTVDPSRLSSAGAAAVAGRPVPLAPRPLGLPAATP